MIFDPLDIPDELLEAQEQGRLVVFAGAGVSRGTPSDLPDFTGLAFDVAKDTPLENELSKHESLLDRYFGELARDDVDIQHLVRKRIGLPTSQPSDLHRWILDLFLDPKNIRIVTTNFDPHFTKVLTERNLRVDQYFVLALPLGRRFRGIVYLHGSILREDDPLILSDEDFGRAYMTEGWARDFLRGMFDKYITLFIGYSHTDPPIEYLARGMSAIRVAPRFALATNEDEDWWNSFRVKPIIFDKPGGAGDFSELGRGIHSWATFSRQQPTDTAQRVRDILLASPEIKPVKSQSSLLTRCLGRKDSCHFFTSVAAGWQFVEWSDEQGLLKPLFDTTTRQLTETQNQLARWLAKMLIAEPSDKGLLLVARHGGAIGRELWQILCHSLWTAEKLDFTLPLVQKWLLLLVSSSPEEHKGEVGHLLRKVAEAAPKTLGLFLFRFLMSFRVTVSSGFAFDLAGTGESLKTRPRAEFDLVLVGDSYDLEEAWDNVFRTLIPVLGRDYLRILDYQLQEMYGVLRALEKADERYDPWCNRSSIRERDAYRDHHDNSLVVDFLLDVVEEMSEKTMGSLLDSSRTGWLRILQRWFVLVYSHFSCQRRTAQIRK
jgi:hypothetical protein